jgi:hypothetical protein
MGRERERERGRGERDNCKTCKTEGQGRGEGGREGERGAKEEKLNPQYQARHITSLQHLGIHSNTHKK